VASCDVARQAGEGGGLHVNSFSSHSLSGRRRCHLINHSNSLSTSNVALNLVSNQSPKSAIDDRH
jgi:hypothetical protein